MPVELLIVVDDAGRARRAAGRAVIRERVGESRVSAALRSAVHRTVCYACEADLLKEAKADIAFGHRAEVHR